MLERLPPGASRLDKDLQILFCFLLANEFRKTPGTECDFRVRFGVLTIRRNSAVSHHLHDLTGPQGKPDN
jgi:hypothetical protein